MTVWSSQNQMKKWQEIEQKSIRIDWILWRHNVYIQIDEYSYKLWLDYYLSESNDILHPYKSRWNLVEPVRTFVAMETL